MRYLILGILLHLYFLTQAQHDSSKIQSLIKQIDNQVNEINQLDLYERYSLYEGLWGEIIYFNEEKIRKVFITSGAEEGLGEYAELHYDKKGNLIYSSGSMHGCLFAKAYFTDNNLIYGELISFRNGEKKVEKHYSAEKIKKEAPNYSEDPISYWMEKYLTVSALQKSASLWSPNDSLNRAMVIGNNVSVRERPNINSYIAYKKNAFDVVEYIPNKNPDWIQLTDGNWIRKDNVDLNIIISFIR